MEIREAEKLGISAEITKIDFSGIMERMRRSVSEGRNRIKKPSKMPRARSLMRWRIMEMYSRWQMACISTQPSQRSS